MEKVTYTHTTVLEDCQRIEKVTYTTITLHNLGGPGTNGLDFP